MSDPYRTARWLQLHVAALKRRAKQIRFGSLADICSAKRDVRFAPNSDINREIWNVLKCQ